LREAVRTVLDRPAHRQRAAQMAAEFARIDTRSKILRIIEQAVADQEATWRTAATAAG
jgi:UDP:flavonoid glycosyltransferase YjiC (YdhE family)